MPLDLFSILSTKNEKLNLSIFLLAWKERTEELFWSNMYLNLRKYIQFWHLKRRHLKAAVERLLPSLPPHFWNADLLLFIVLRRGGWGSSPYLTEATNLPAKSDLVTMRSCALFSFLMCPRVFSALPSKSTFAFYVLHVLIIYIPLCVLALAHTCLCVFARFLDLVLLVFYVFLCKRTLCASAHHVRELISFLRISTQFLAQKLTYIFWNLFLNGPFSLLFSLLLLSSY